ncbi:putative glutamyl-trna amidotransferase subunit protein [Botrytis fragariae]|uniref:Putative glutamyl-trna amidotransferase subunit protein n=1 Tax=Botrytis fragariae TaxID=1964551 RepID=A0A8H6AKU2_9HELO|nr:putative glutamyl-trna amidotransferase subunit protein [Botrytis fragariae]KAF5869166.1 putative glutamyl-trna amidotransferase subunit protein [Botrytis fragariae]
MPGQEELCLLSATQILSLLKDNVVSVEDYARSLLHRIDQRNDIVKAWACMDMPTEFGCSLYQGNQPTLDSSAVSILRNAGALIFGKTTTPELTWLNSGPKTTNPHNVTRTPGGSSTGSAAAVADFQVPLSIGTQTGGSLVRPASYTGVFAMKPTYNAISLEGQKICSISLDTFGFFARSIEDLRLLADVLCLKDAHPHKTIPLKEIQIAFMQTPMWDQAGPGTITAMNSAFTILHNRGIKIDQVPFPQNTPISKSSPKTSTPSTKPKRNHPSAKNTTRINQNSTPKSALLSKPHPTLHKNISKLSNTSPLSEKPSLLPSSPNTTQFSLPASQTKHLSVCTIWEVRYSISSGQCVYFMLPPYTHLPPPPHPHPHLITSTNPTHTLQPQKSTHMPVLNIPAFISPNNMPIGLSLIAAPFCDQHLLHLAKRIAEPLMSEGGWKINLPV